VLPEKKDETNENRLLHVTLNTRKMTEMPAFLLARVRLCWEDFG
jgi:hypothetical protein